MQESVEVITTHINADFDALASLIAASKLYPGASLVFPGSQEKNLRYFFLHSTSYLFNFSKMKQIKFDRIKIQLTNNLLNCLVTETAVFFKEGVVEFPEFSLALGSQRSLGSFKSVFMAADGKVLVNDFYLIWIFFEQLLK